ncbi:MAG: iron-sulfur cluster repair di-iron protein [Bacteroidetes bacterium]|nr:iron-sulfur cluster repair di-iron protein [Bacteroidota bacterium]
MNPGESFIIHNDHDPKPLYYQLLNEHGESFSWEYLTQGPQWWDIKVTIKELAPLNKEGETVINVPSLEPKLKHPTIFKTFDTLQPGESLIIHNDHDPKPVYYQLLGERGDVFTWEYLQQGPQWWDIRVTRKGADDHATIGQIAAKDLRKAEVFKKYGIDFCCGGKKTVREACAEKGIDATKVEQELQQPVQGAVTSGTLNYDEWNLGFLADYIVNTHHNYVRKYLPEITGYAKKVAKVHGDKHPELIQINNLVETVNKELSEHLADEENKIFPLVKEIVKTKDTGAAYTRKGNNSFAYLVKATEEEHESVGDAMKEIRRLSKNYAIPDDGCTSYKLLYKMLDEFENDLFVHIHLENNILFPKAEEIEKSIL